MFEGPACPRRLTGGGRTFLAKKKSFPAKPPAKKDVIILCRKIENKTGSSLNAGLLSFRQALTLCSTAEL